MDGDIGAEVHGYPIGEGYRLLEDGERIQEGDEFFRFYGVKDPWSRSSEVGGIPSNRHLYRTKRPKSLSLDESIAEQEATVPNDSADVLRYGATKETTEPPHWSVRMEVSTDPPKDPKTKYHRPMYPAWNDPQVHTDANGKQYINVDVYSVLAAFKPGDEAGHAVKKLLAAGSRDKGSKIQDYREAIISIEAAIYRAEIEGGAG
jgi:hypothetical protein